MYGDSSCLCRFCEQHQVSSSMHFLDSLVNSHGLLCLRQSKSGRDYDLHLLRCDHSHYVQPLVDGPFGFSPKELVNAFATSSYSTGRMRAIWWTRPVGVQKCFVSTVFGL